MGEGFEICQVVLKVQGDAHAVFVCMRESQLECPEEAGGPRHRRSHESKFSEQLLPFLDANSPLVMKVFKYGKKVTLPPVSQFQSFLRHVQDPSQDFLPLTPSTFTFQELLLSYGFLMFHCHRVRLGEDIVHCMHDTPPDILAPAPRALCNTDKVDNKNINVCDGPSMFHERDMILGLWQWQCKLCELLGQWWQLAECNPQVVAMATQVLRQFW